MNFLKNKIQCNSRLWFKGWCTWKGRSEKQGSFFLRSGHFN